MHKSLLEGEKKSYVDAQRRLNLKMKKLLKQKFKLLEEGIIYPILDSEWGTVHVVPMKGGIMVVQDDDIEWIATRLMTN